MIFDTHAHCYWDSLLPHIEDIVLRMQQKWIQKVTQIWCDISTSLKAIELAERFPGVFSATAGFHPETAQNMFPNTEYLNELEKLIEINREYVVAVGECGFDFHYLDGTNDGKTPFDRTHPSEIALRQIENQKYWWLEQWKIGKKYNLPLIIHTRDARNETLSFMKENEITRCVMHCFSEDLEFARELLEFSDEIYFSFSGILTYKNAKKIQEAATHVPLNRILVETDAPFLSPEPLRGTINEPANTYYTLEKLIELRSESKEQIISQVYQNSLQFFSL